MQKRVWLILSLGVSIFLLSGIAFVVNAQANRVIPNYTSPSFQFSGSPSSADINTKRLTTSTNSGTLNRDNWQEFTTQKNQQIEQYRKRIEEEIQQKRKSLQEERKRCNEQLQNYIKQRREQRQQLLQTCMPKNLTSTMIKEQVLATGASVSAVQNTYRLQRQDCLNQLKTFEQETQTGIKSTKESCRQTERQVLGLSTEVAW